MAASDINALKKSFLRLLEEDEEFRYAVAAKIGLLEILMKLEEHDRKFNEILKRLDRHEEIFLRHEEELKRIWEKMEEHDKKFNEILQRLDRHEEEIKKIWEKLEEHDRKFNEMLTELREHRRKLEEHDRKFNEILAELREHRSKLGEHDKKFDEVLGELREHRERLEEHTRILEEHTRILEKHTSMLGSLGENIGVLSEAMLARFVGDDVLDELRLRGVRVLSVRRRHVVNGYEVDLYIETEEEVIVVEVKTRLGVEDVDKLGRVRDYLVEKKGKRVRVILASYRAKTRGDVVERVSEKGVELLLY